MSFRGLAGLHDLVVVAECVTSGCGQDEQEKYFEIPAGDQAKRNCQHVWLAPTVHSSSRHRAPSSQGSRLLPKFLSRFMVFTPTKWEIS